MNLTQYNNILKPIDNQELWDRVLDKDKLIDLGNGEYRYEDDLLIRFMGVESLTDIYYNIVEVAGSFWCGDNPLTTLEGCPEKIGRTFWCAATNLTSLEGCPKEVAGDFYCYGNPTKFTEEYVRSLCDVGSGVYV